MKIKLPELELLYLGISHNGTFDEKNIEDANIGKYGVGRVLDVLAELREKKWLELKDGKFSITTAGRHLLWNEKMPLWLRILHLLEVKSFPKETISTYLNKEDGSVEKELENLRKNGLVMMTTIRTDAKIEKMFEILPEGLEEIEKIQKDGFENAELVIKENKNLDILDLLNEIKKIIEKESIGEERKSQIINKIAEIEKKLGI